MNNLPSDVMPRPRSQRSTTLPPPVEHRPSQSNIPISQSGTQLPDTQGASPPAGQGHVMTSHGPGPVMVTDGTDGASVLENTPAVTEPLSPECLLPISDNDADDDDNSLDGEVNEDNSDDDGGNGNDDDEQQNNLIPDYDEQQNNSMPTPEFSPQMSPSVNNDNEILPTGPLKPSQGLEGHPSRVLRSNSLTAHNDTQPNGDK